MATLGAMFNPSDKSCPGGYRPEQTALLLLDFHTLFVQRVGGPYAPGALTAAAEMRHWAKAQGMRVIHGLVDTNATPFATCKGGDRFADVVAAMKAGGGEEAAELLADIDESDAFFTRTPGHVSALLSTGLPEYLRENDIKSLLLTGLSTSGCVLRTCVPATDAEFVVTVISDACADPRDGVHDLLVTKVLPSHAFVAKAAEFQEGYAGAMGGN